MCSAVSDYLVVYFFLKLVGMLRIKDGKISNCNFDVTGLFETVEDMKRAPCIISELLEIKLIHDYIIEQRKGSVTIMLGYSDSVRDGSSLASDAQVNRTAIIFRGLEQNIRKKYGYPFEFVFYRGRGDTLPRGYGGAIDGAILAQAYTTPKEDHTEQNRYLRRYFSEESAMNHYHSIYSAHLASQLLVKNENEERYQLFFDFFGTISNMKWNELVKENNGGNGAVYFKVLNTYSILPHLNHSHFASRPISRGKNFNIDTIRAIPFTMNLAQLRDLSSAFYGTGTGFELGSKLLMDGDNTVRRLVKILHNNLSEEKRADLLQLNLQNAALDLLKILDIKLADCLKISDDPILLRILSLYPSIEKGVDHISSLLVYLHDNQTSPISVLREMFLHYLPFRYSIENKETALQIRDKRIIDLYLADATPEEKSVFEEAEKEAQLTKHWILDIMDQDELQQKSLILKKNVHSEELFLLHLIQSYYLRSYRKLQKENGNTQQLQALETYIQMTILAISEGLGFGG
jgi:phosphoenolpyruvate carboxylase